MTCPFGLDRFGVGDEVMGRVSGQGLLTKMLVVDRESVMTSIVLCAFVRGGTVVEERFHESALSLVRRARFG